MIICLQKLTLYFFETFQVNVPVDHVEIKSEIESISSDESGKFFIILLLSITYNHLTLFSMTFEII